MITSTALSGKTAAIILGVAGAAGGLNMSVMALTPSADASGTTEGAAASTDPQRVQVVVDVPTAASPETTVDGTVAGSGETGAPAAVAPADGQPASLAWSQSNDASVQAPAAPDETLPSAPATTAAPATTTAPPAPKPTAAPPAPVATTTVPAPVTTASGGSSHDDDDDEHDEHDDHDDEHEYEGHESREHEDDDD
ncbi:MAG: hypothetical protein R2733_22030 [Acidimicrobiales bacterium]